VSRQIRRTVSIRLVELLPHALIDVGIVKTPAEAEEYLKNNTVDAFLDTTVGVDAVQVTLISTTEKTP